MEITQIDPYYDVGTATLNTSGRTMTGQGTQWSGRVVPGDQVFGSDGRMGGIVESVNSNTSITLAKNWRGANQTAAVYTIHRVSDSVRVEQFSQRLLNLLLGGNLTALGELTLAADKGVMATGAGALGLFDLTSQARQLLDDASFADMRETLGVAQRQSSPTDATSGRSLLVGGFGVGAVGAGTPFLPDFNDASVPNGFYRWNSATENAPSNQGGGAVKFDRGQNRASWLAASASGGVGVTEPAFFVKSTSGSADDWGVWRPLTPERGSNSNGEYVRFADGTQICTHTLDLGPRDAVGSGTYSNPYRTQTPNWTFPAAFIDSNVQFNATAFVDSVGAAQRVAFVGARAITSTVVNQVQGYTGSDASGNASITAAMVAIGRWF